MHMVTEFCSKYLNDATELESESDLTPLLCQLFSSCAAPPHGSTMISLRLSSVTEAERAELQLMSSSVSMQ